MPQPEELLLGALMLTSMLAPAGAGELLLAEEEEAAGVLGSLVPAASARGLTTYGLLVCCSSCAGMPG